MLQQINGKEIIASRELTVENTTFCGAKCIMCPRDEYSFSWQHMNFDMFKTVIDQGVELGITSLDLCGFGDPLIDPGFRQKLEYAKTRHPQLHVYISTTGHLLYKKNLDWLCEFIGTMKISNYGYSKESYEHVHAGVVKFEKVWENIHNLLARPQGTRPYVIMSFLVFPQNEHEIEDWKAYWAPRCEEIMVWRPHNYGGAASIEDLSYHTGARQAATEARSCGRPFRGNPFVRVNGDISVCCFDFNRNLTVGNLVDQTMYEILAGAQLAHVKDVHARKSFSGCGLLCQGCDQLFDRGDALIFASNTSRKVDQPTTHPDHIVNLVGAV